MHPDRGRAITSHIDTIKDDIGLEKTTEIRDTMLDQAVWENFVRMAGGDSRRKKKKKQEEKEGSYRANCSKDDWREFTISNDNPTGL